MGCLTTSAKGDRVRLVVVRVTACVSSLLLGVLLCCQAFPFCFVSKLHCVAQARRQVFHQGVYSTADIDLFLYGLDEAAGLRKLEEVYAAVREAVSAGTLCLCECVSTCVSTCVSMYVCVCVSV
jgi:hypothetical protein